MPFEFVREYAYKYPRHRVHRLLDGTAVAQYIGMRETKVWTCEWVRAERIRELIEANFPQSDDTDFVIEGEPNVEKAIGDGHNLFNVSVTASRLLADTAASESPLMTEGVTG